ncbi:MAG: 6-phosphofructokinase [Gammaproteobacteria bacterium]|nr:6-phosphofructokinase [Gammaproteobacteria bacterium]
MSIRKPMKKIVILTSGGDAPGMNAAVRAAVRTALAEGLEVWASHSGYQGLVSETLVPLDSSAMANCIQLGGTILKTDRCQAFFEKTVRQRCAHFLKSKLIDGLIIIGGDGSFRGATLLQEEGGPAIVGIPATIDNDIEGTDYTIGFDTARNTALSAIDRIRDTASSHNRNFMVEVMGRHAGFLALDVGIAGGAEYILIPEYPLTIDKLSRKMLEPSRKKMSSIIVVAEGENPGHTLDLAKKLSDKTGITYKVCILGHIQRGGSPSALDRKLASLMGHTATKMLINGIMNKMVALQHDQLILVDFPDPQQPGRRVPDKTLLDLNDIICK